LFAAARLPRFSGHVRVGPIDPRGGSAEQLPAHQPTGVVRRSFKEPPLTAESGGATRATPLAMRAHCGTGSSNPLPSSSDSANSRSLPRSFSGATAENGSLSRSTNGSNPSPSSRGSATPPNPRSAKAKPIESEYRPGHAAYDRKKLRGKQIVRRIGYTRRYAMKAVFHELGPAA
jgi:hypothetical protein